MGHLHGLAGMTRRRLMVRAAATSAILSLLFLVVYGGTNYFTSLRSDVGTWYYAWERYIPFVPLMVLPYMSIDLFFVAAPFLCRDKREMNVFAGRVALALVVAGTFFLLMPLKLAVPRPQLEGVLGTLFGWFFQADKPFNLCPSLHIALRGILAETYARHTRGLWNAASHVWFSLIGVSTLLTHQHHVVDIVGGFMLAAVVFYVVPGESHAHPVTPSRRIATYYAAGMLGGIVLAIVLWPWGAWFFWPAGACAIAMGAYSGLGSGIYRKVNGRLTLSTRLILLPLLLGQRISLWWYARQCRPWDEITPHLLIGRVLNRREAEELVRQGVTDVLDLTAEFSEAAPLVKTRYLNVPILDLTAPTPEQLHRCLEFISQHARNGRVYVHCKIGYSRTAAVVGAYLLESGRVNSADEAIAVLRAARPSIIIRSEAEAVIRNFR